jgi:hypothetical protein
MEDDALVEPTVSVVKVPPGDFVATDAACGRGKVPARAEGACVAAGSLATEGVLAGVGFLVEVAGVLGFKSPAAVLEALVFESAIPFLHCW